MSRIAIRCQTEFAEVYLRLVELGYRVHWTDLRMLLQRLSPADSERRHRHVKLGDLRPALLAQPVREFSEAFEPAKKAAQRLTDCTSIRHDFRYKLPQVLPLTHNSSYLSRSFFRKSQRPSQCYQLSRPVVKPIISCSPRAVADLGERLGLNARRAMKG